MVEIIIPVYTINDGRLVPRVSKTSIESTSKIMTLVNALLVPRECDAPATCRFRIWKVRSCEHFVFTLLLIPRQPNWNLTSSGIDDLRTRVKMNSLGKCCVCISDDEWENRPVSDLELVDLNSQFGICSAKTRALIVESYQLQEDEDTASEREGEDDVISELREGWCLPANSISIF